MRKNAFAGVSVLALCLAGTQAFAQSATGPFSNFGVIASHNQYKLTIADESDKERLNQGGLYYSFGNKLTGQEGFIYQIGAEGQYRDKDDVEYLSARADLDLVAHGRPPNSIIDDLGPVVRRHGSVPT